MFEINAWHNPIPPRMIQLHLAGRRIVGFLRSELDERPKHPEDPDQDQLKRYRNSS